jgi:hypothetical protein
VGEVPGGAGETWRERCAPGPGGRDRETERESAEARTQVEARGEDAA